MKKEILRVNLQLIQVGGSACLHPRHDPWKGHLFFKLPLVDPVLWRQIKTTWRWPISCKPVVVIEKIIIVNFVDDNKI